MGIDTELDHAFLVHALLPWRLAIAPHPRSAEMELSLAHWSNSGVTHVWSFLDRAEIEHLGLEHESLQCHQIGLGFDSFPIVDRGVPELDAAVSIAMRQVEQLRVGEFLLLHCRHGIGRSAVMAALVMFLSGAAAPDIFPLLSQTRGRTVPDTREQFDWFFHFAACLRLLRR